MKRATEGVLRPECWSSPRVFLPPMRAKVSRAAPLVVVAAFMIFQTYLVVETWGLRSAPTVSIIVVTVAACLPLICMALRRD